VEYTLKISLWRKKRNDLFFPGVMVLLLILWDGLFLYNQAHAQVPSNPVTSLDEIPYDSISIDRIFIIGNRRTKEQIIRRELDFTDGDRISTVGLSDRIKRNEEKLVNTSLFLTVKISLIELNLDRVDVIIRLVERWYIFPIPVLELADRNFKDWWVNQEHDFSRIEWGLKLYLYNMRGRNETLRLQGQLGYTKRFRISYAFPYVDKRQHFGLRLLFDYKQNKNTFYTTENNKLLYLDSDNWLKEQYIGGISTTYRKNFYSFHTMGMNFYNTQVNDTLVELNPGYFREGKTQQRFLNIHYSFVLDKRDIAVYPLEGSYFIGSIGKNGLGVWDEVDNLELSALYYKYIDLGRHFYLMANAGFQLLTPSDQQPYNVYNRMGVGNFTLHGYELYVIEGPFFLQNQWTVRKLLFKMERNLTSVIPIRQLSRFYLALYAKTYFDLGYVDGYPNNEFNTRLTDQLLYSGGLGLDLVTIYDIVLRFEYSYNKQRESGFVFGFRGVF
jgi:outer membrane protein assembly factor BamA